MRKSDQLIQSFLEMDEDVREDAAWALGILVGSFFVKRSLRKKGANEWQVYVATSVMTSLTLMNRKLDRIATRLKETP